MELFFSTPFLSVLFSFVLLLRQRPWLFRRRHTIEPLFVTTPQPLRALCSVHVTRIVCGDSHCAAIGVSRLGREAHEEFQLLQLNDSSLRKERILEELKRRSATSHDDEDHLQKASSSFLPSSHHSPPTETAAKRKKSSTIR